MSFMDRVSIGNARLYNMEIELGMEDNDYLLAVSVLFITYCVRDLTHTSITLQSHLMCEMLTCPAFRDAIECDSQAHAACAMAGWNHNRMGPCRNFLGIL